MISGCFQTESAPRGFAAFVATEELLKPSPWFEPRLFPGIY
jgi:hypothetical protein